jgi:hypothetical protein
VDDKMTWPPYVAALFGVGLLRRRSFNSIEIFYCPYSIEIFYFHRNILLPLILLRHIHHLPYIAMSWPSILEILVFASN